MKTTGKLYGRLARRLNPDVAYAVGDMRTLRLGRTYDAVVAWDSLNHMTGPADLEKVFATAYRHLEKGGVFFFLLDTDRAQFRQGAVDGYIGRGKGVKIAFIENLYDPDPSDSHYETRFVFLIRRKGGFSVETDRFRCGLFSAGEVPALLRKRGFRARFLKCRPGAEALEGCSSGQGYYPAFIAVK
ncbi:MAG: type 11 methyltransferase [Elusimicrobia bacterium]|nr:MAG: type 11 methyltransferase [Elusimicrobiota bacterium]KAF0155558.1 MAG: type 11 methyltransferase [Elusimicrobiota bacterium]